MSWDQRFINWLLKEKRRHERIRLLEEENRRLDEKIKLESMDVDYAEPQTRRTPMYLWEKVGESHILEGESPFHPNLRGASAASAFPMRPRVHHPARRVSYNG